jgi:hypothetical protein
MPARADCFELNRDRVTNDRAAVRPRAVLGEVHALPGAEQHPPVGERDGRLEPVSIALTCAGMSSGPSSSCS